MVQSRQQTPSGTRRSRRLASQEPSVAESDNDTGSFPSHSRTTSSPLRKQSFKLAARTPTRVQATRTSAFDPLSTVERITRGDRALINKLTKPQLVEVVKAFADRAETSIARIDDLTASLERKERESDTMTMKRGQQSLRLAEIMRKHAPQQTTETPAPPPPAPAERAPTSPPATPAACAFASMTPVAPPSTVWTSIKSLFSTSFSRKRAAEDEPASPAPSQKRKKATEPEPAAIEQPATTPAPKRKRMAAATPLSGIPESSPKPMTAITPRPRTIASVRAAKSAMKATPSRLSAQRYAWEPTPRAKEPNADARIAKIRRAECLRRELAQIEQEEPLTRRIKRVKVDHLPEIPHNRPGDSSSTFRVPDIDSDDEIEVEDSVQVRTNIFSPPEPPVQQVTTPQHPPSQPEQQIAAPKPQTAVPEQQTAVPEQQKAATKQQSTVAKQQIAAPEPPRFSFPSVAPRQASYFVSEAYKEACGARFAAGLAMY